MGIYSTGKIYGVRMGHDYNELDFIVNHKYEKTYDAVMTDEQRREALEFYRSLDHNKLVRIYLYTEVFTTYDPKDKSVSLMWMPSHEEEFLHYFNV